MTVQVRQRTKAQTYNLNLHLVPKSMIKMVKSLKNFLKSHIRNTIKETRGFEPGKEMFKGTHGKYRQILKKKKNRYSFRNNGYSYKQAGDSNNGKSYLEKQSTVRTITEVTLDWDWTVSCHLLQLQFSMLPAAK